MYYIPTGDWPLKIQPYHQLLQYMGLYEGSLNNADILVLPGGSDIGMRPGRDKVEFALYKKWMLERKPVIGICRGLQLMLKLTDGSLVEHLPDVTDKIMHTTITGDWRGQSSWHTTEAGLLTNSRHHQGFMDANEDFWQVIDKTSDGVIEAICNEREFAVQWHPEHEEMRGTPALEWWAETLKRII